MGFLRTRTTGVATATLLTLAASSGAAPVDIFYQGQLVDGGVALTGTHTIETRWYASATGGAAITPPASASVTVGPGGQFALDVPADTDFLDGTDVWLEFTVDGLVLAPRQPIGTVPSAAFARNAPFKRSSATGDLGYADGSIGIGTLTPEGELGIENVGPSDDTVLLNMGESEDLLFYFEAGFAGTGATGNKLKLETGFGSNAMTWLANGWIGSRNQTPAAPFHIGNGLGITDGQIGNDDLVIESGDAKIGLYSNNNGSLGSGMVLGEYSGGVPIDWWDVVRSTSPQSYLNFNYNDGGGDTTIMRLAPAGVGIGDVAPSTLFDLYETLEPTAGEPVASFAFDNASGFASTVGITANSQIASQAALSVEHLGRGAAAVFEAGQAGELADTVIAENNGTGAAIHAFANDAGDALSGFAADNGAVPLRLRMDSAVLGDLAVLQRFGTNVARIDSNGRGYFNGGTQASGADVAEAFEVEGDIGAYEPGDVLVISVERDRTVAKSRAPYSTLVSGVHATKPGVLLTERTIDESLDDCVPMGVVGVIPTKVTTENGPIRRGDLLVTSSVRGHAMRGTDRERMVGAILGKALENFDGDGEGVIRVMVSVR